VLRIFKKSGLVVNVLRNRHGHDEDCVAGEHAQVSHIDVDNFEFDSCEPGLVFFHFLNHPWDFCALFKHGVLSFLKGFELLFVHDFADRLENLESGSLVG
jgi:hypothetical protein